VCALSALQLALVGWDLALHLDDPLIVYWAVAALFVAATVPLALYDIHCHLVRFVSPLQRYYVRILLLLPIYCVESWLALRFQRQALYLETLRDLYEAFVIHAFMQLLIHYLGDREQLKARLAARGAFVNVTLFPYGVAALEPFACAPPDRGGRLWCLFWPSGATFLFRCEVGVYQYVVVKCVLTVAFFVTSLTGTLGEDSPYSYQSFFPYWSWGILVSQVWAITCLVLFYESTWRWIAPLQPLRKFVCVKGMVFVTWAQGELISYLNDLGLVALVGAPGLAPGYAAEGLQDVIICVEMLALAYLHHLYFNASDFDEETGILAQGSSRGLSFAAPADGSGARQYAEGLLADGDDNGEGDGDEEARPARGEERPQPPKTLSARDVVRLILPIELVTSDLRLHVREGVVEPLRAAAAERGRARTLSPDKSAPA